MIGMTYEKMRMQMLLFGSEDLLVARATIDELRAQASENRRMWSEALMKAVKRGANAARAHANFSAATAYIEGS